MSGRPLDPPAGEAAQRAQLAAWVADDAALMRALRAAASLGLASWCIGAGAVRNLVWDRLHGAAQPAAAAPDVDLVFHDPANLSAERERQLQARLQHVLPGVPWEVVNQAAVHRWLPGAVRPLQSLEEGVGSWPETATCVGAWLDAAGAVHTLAPHGLADLFAGVVRHNPARVPASVYRQRLVEKRFAERWPGLTILPA
jgi:hypothetical protein